MEMQQQMAETQMAKNAAPMAKSSSRWITIKK